MPRIVEVDENGAVQLPMNELPHLKPHTRLRLAIEGDRVILEPEVNGVDSSEIEARVRALYEWAEAPRRPAPSIPADALRRENLY